MRLPSFCAKKTSGWSPCALRAQLSAWATRLVTPPSVALSTVAFSRSRRPTVPISWLRDRSTLLPATSRTRSAALSSCSGETGANTLTIATASTRSAIGSTKRAMASSSSGAIGRLSNSKPPPTMTSPADTASRRSGGHVDSGGTASVAGAPSRTTATRRRPRRSRIALVAWVVPSITWVIRSGVTEGEPRTAVIARSMPSLTSGVVGTFAFATRRSSPSSTTASVLVPPTSTPSRSSDRSMELLDRYVREVITKRPRARHLETPRRAPDRVRGKADHGHALPVADPLRPDRLGRLGVEHRDDVWCRSHHAAVAESDQILVLNLETQHLRCRIELRNCDRASNERTARAAFDVDDAARDEFDSSQLGADGGDPVVFSF